MTDFRDIRQDARLEALERRVAAILEDLSLEDPAPATAPGVSAHVVQLVRAGRTVQAVQAHMDATGSDLATARDAVARVSRTA